MSNIKIGIADSSSAMAAIKQDRLDINLSIPLDAFRQSWRTFGALIDPTLMDAKGWTEDDVRVGCAALSSLALSLPLSTGDLMMWLLENGCHDEMRYVATKHLGLVEQEA